MARDGFPMSDEFSIDELKLYSRTELVQPNQINTDELNVNIQFGRTVNGLLMDWAFEDLMKNLSVGINRVLGQICMCACELLVGNHCVFCRCD